MPRKKQQYWCNPMLCPLLSECRKIFSQEILMHQNYHNQASEINPYLWFSIPFWTTEEHQWLHHVHYCNRASHRLILWIDHQIVSDHHQMNDGCPNKQTFGALVLLQHCLCLHSRQTFLINGQMMACTEKISASHTHQCRYQYNARINKVHWCMYAYITGILQVFFNLSVMAKPYRSDPVLLKIWMFTCSEQEWLIWF